VITDEDSVRKVGVYVKSNERRVRAESGSDRSLFVGMDFPGDGGLNLDLGTPFLSFGLLPSPPWAFFARNSILNLFILVA